MFKDYKRNLIATVVCLLLLAIPAVAYADAAITSFNMDRTSVDPGQAVTFTLRTTEDVNYVFAEVEGVRVQGTQQSSNTWQLVVSPTRSQDITIAANATNSIADAAMINIPIVVNAAAATPAQPIAHTPSVPAGNSPPITLAPVTSQPVAPGAPAPAAPAAPTQPLAIVSIQEIPADAANYVRLLVVTGNAANETWVQFDENRFRRGEEILAERTPTTRTWEINFRPNAWSSQTVSVNANREYVVAGATVQHYTLALNQPFVPPVVDVPATVLSAVVTNRTVTPGGIATFTITTNPEAGYVWVIDASGQHRQASRTGQTAINSTWTVSFAPASSGAVTIHANNINNPSGASTRIEHLTVQDQPINFSNTSAYVLNWNNNWNWNWYNQGTVRVSVTTNQFAERVWVELPDGRGQRQLSRQSGTGSSSRVWTGDIENIGNVGSLRVYASRTSSLNNRDGSTSVSVSGWSNWNNNWYWNNNWHWNNNWGWPGHSWASVHFNSNPDNRITGTQLNHHNWSNWSTWSDATLTITTQPNVDRVRVNLWGSTREAVRTSSVANTWTVHIPASSWNNSNWGHGSSISIETRTPGDAWRTATGTLGW